MFCIPTIGPEILPPFKLTSQPVPGCWYFSDSWFRDRGSNCSQQKPCAECLIWVNLVKAPITDACVSSESGDRGGAWRVCACPVKLHFVRGTGHLPALSSAAYCQLSPGKRAVQNSQGSRSAGTWRCAHTLGRLPPLKWIRKYRLRVRGQCPTCQAKNQAEE